MTLFHKPYVFLLPRLFANSFARSSCYFVTKSKHFEPLKFWCRFKTYMYACKHVSTWLVNFPREGPRLNRFTLKYLKHIWSTTYLKHIPEYKKSQVPQVQHISSTVLVQQISSTSQVQQKSQVYLRSTTRISSTSQKHNNSQVHLKYNISQVHLKSIKIFQAHLKYEVFSSIAANHDCPDSGWKNTLVEHKPKENMDNVAQVQVCALLKSQMINAHNICNHRDLSAEER